METAACVEEIVRQHVGSSDVLLPEVHLLDELSIDSLELVELGVTLEKKFAITLPDAEVRRCVTLADVIQLVEGTINVRDVKSA